MRSPRLRPLLALTCTILAGVTAWALWKQPFLELAGFGSNTIDGYSWEDIPADADRTALIKITWCLLAAGLTVWLPSWLKIIALGATGYASFLYYQCLEPHLETIRKMKALALEGGAEAEAMVKTALDGIKPLLGAWLSGPALILLGILLIVQLASLAKPSRTLTPA